MSLLPTPGDWADAGTGLLLVLLGLWLARRRPRRRANLAFAAFSAAVGSAFLMFNLASIDDPLFPTLALLVAVADVVAAAALALLAWWFPRPVAAHERAVVVVAGLAAAAWTLAYETLLFTDPSAFARTWGVPADTQPAALVNFAAFTVLRGAMWFALLLHALRFLAARGPEAGWDRRQYAFLGAALLMYPGILGGMEAAAEDVRWGLPSLAMLGVLAVLWLLSTRRGPHTAAARTIALLALALPLVGLLIVPVLGGFAAAKEAGPLGASRTAMMLLLAYGILRHQLLGIDVKVKWTVKQSTVAAAFVGVFFVVSEGAASFFADTAGSQYLGIMAAGMLVFVLAPLQRAAEKVADAALPGVKPPAKLGREERARIYLENARQAWSDGSINREERAMLDRLRSSLGLSAEDAMRLEGEAAR